LQGKEKRPNSEEAEASFQKAFNVARQQEAKSFELRAATSLARLWQRQGKTTEAHELLTPVYNRFSHAYQALTICFTIGGH
jgi:predicted ATPase